MSSMWKEYWDFSILGRTRSAPPLIFVNKFSCNTATFICLCIVSDSFFTTMAESNSCTNDRVAHRPLNFYCFALYRPVVLNFNVITITWESLKNAYSIPAGLVCGLKFCISNRLPGLASAAGPQAAL